MEAETVDEIDASASLFTVSIAISCYQATSFRRHASSQVHPGFSKFSPMQITSKTELFQDSSLYVLSKGQVRIHGIREAFNTDRTKYIIAHFKTKSDRILSKPAVSGVLGHGFPLPLNPTVENTTWTLHSDTDGNEF